MSIPLLEYEAKQRVAAHGIEVPAGCLWPGTPGCSTDHFVVKAQVPEGRRAKRGGIVFAERAEIAGAADRMLGSRIGAHEVALVYVEERLDIRSELYAAAFIDRDARCVALLVSPDGGVDVEDVAENRLCTVRIDPLTGLRPFHLRQMRRVLRVSAALERVMDDTLARLYTAAVQDDAELLELNPLAVTGDGRVVAADVKMIVDRNAAFRHPEWRDLTFAGEGSDVEREVAAAGATAIEIDPNGDLVAVVSGAGLMMATLDLLTTAGAKIRCMVDLGGTPLADPRGLVPILGAMVRLKPQTLFVNAYFQTAFADDFARAILEAHHAAPLPRQVFVRLKGRNAERARDLLSPLGIVTLEDLATAIDAVTGRVERSRSR